LLAGTDRRARLEALAVIREPLYREIAAITVRTDGRAPTAVAADIGRALADAGAG
jgi:shikimate kinase